MFNPRFMEAESSSIQNPWFTFALLHTYEFWKEEIVCTIIPGAQSNNISQALMRYNGFGVGYPEQYKHNTLPAFNASPKDIWRAKEAFVVIDDPINRLLKLPQALEADSDNCSNILLAETGKFWSEFSFRELVERICLDKELQTKSHWWCKQEWCLALRHSEYSRIFRSGDYDGLKWWLGERGIQLEGSEDKEPAVDLSNLQDATGILSDEPLRDSIQKANVAEQAKSLLTHELIELIQETFSEDYLLFNRDA